jgi:hypothetical protein
MLDRFIDEWPRQSGRPPTWKRELIAFREWLWALPDFAKEVLAAEVSESPTLAAPILNDARRAANAAVEELDRRELLDEVLSSAHVALAHSEHFERDMKFVYRWQAKVVSPLLQPLDDALLGVACRDVLPRGHRRVLLDPVMDAMRESLATAKALAPEHVETLQRFVLQVAA